MGEGGDMEGGNGARGVAAKGETIPTAITN